MSGMNHTESPAARVHKEGHWSGFLFLFYDVDKQVYIKATGLTLNLISAANTRLPCLASVAFV